MKKLKKYIIVIGYIEVADGVYVHEFSPNKYLGSSHNDIKMILEETGIFYEEICELVDEVE